MCVPYIRNSASLQVLECVLSAEVCGATKMVY